MSDDAGWAGFTPEQMGDLIRYLEPWFDTRGTAGNRPGGIRKVTSDDLSVTVVRPRGPVVDLSVPPPTPSTNSVLMAGAVYNDADIIRGTGFSVVLVTVGSPGVPAEYTVTFDTALPVTPVTLLTPNNNNGPVANDGTYTATIKDGTESTTGFSVLTTAFNPVAPTNDGGWNFACFTPGPAS